MKEMNWDLMMIHTLIFYTFVYAALSVQKKAYVVGTVSLDIFY